MVHKGKAGTTLVITGGDRWEWGLRGYNWLKRQLAVLVANRGAKRKGFKEDPGFDITLEAPDFTEKPRDLREDLVNAGWGTIDAHVLRNGMAKCTLKAIDLGSRRATGLKVYKHLSGVRLKIGILAADPNQIRDKSVLSKGTMSEILKEWGGVQVKRNGVRIFPYGDDDWLNVDADRGRRLGAPSKDLQLYAGKLDGVDPQRALLSLLSHKSYLGTVFIDSRDEGFQPKANREGFMETDAVRELRHFARYCIDWATIYRDYWIREQKKAKAEQARKEFEETTEAETPRSEVVKAAAIHIQKQLDRIAKTPSENERLAAVRSVTPAVKAILAQDQANEGELRHLRLIASSSTLLLIFSHEVKSFLTDIDNTEGIVEGMLRSSRGITRRELNRLKLQLSESKTRFEQLLEMTALVGVDARKSKPVRLALRDRIERAVSCFSLVISSYDVSVDYSQVALNVMVGPMLEAELYAIILNALSNALKSVIAAGKVKKIKISAERMDGKAKFLVSDTGLGLGSSKFQEVFTPFVADPEGRLYPGLDDCLDPADKHIVGTGSGLGLSIIKEIVTSLNGSVRFIKPRKPWKAQLEVLVP
ncbi:MAG: HAMP domain-containing sensor histidine kinase [Thermodesulfobacteriota bacterium]|nr:HAMP domain-containing sensor histidine kinase [Thermodesulfobacteriota bacterium]